MQAQHGQDTPWCSMQGVWPKQRALPWAPRVRGTRRTRPLVCGDAAEAGLLEGSGWDDADGIKESSLQTATNILTPQNSFLAWCRQLSQNVELEYMAPQEHERPPTQHHQGPPTQHHSTAQHKVVTCTKLPIKRMPKYHKISRWVIN